MGCIGYICQGCGKPVNDEEGTHLFLLQRGQLLEEMHGHYNNYGATKEHEWQTDWGHVCNLNFNPNTSNGIAAFHSDCWDGTVPTQRSKDDEKQGSGPCRHKFKGGRWSHTIHKKYDPTPSLEDVEREKRMEELNRGLSKTIAEAQAFLDSLKKK
jgi:hypothetical protein